MRFLKLIMLVLAISAVPAQAATIVGESEGDFYFDDFALDLSAPGEYRVTVDFTAPVEELFLSVELAEFYNQYLPDDLSTVIGGNDTSSLRAIAEFGPLSSAAFTFAIPAAFSGFEDGLFTTTQFAVTGGAIEFFSEGAVGYAITVTALNTTAVPEPATWALLIFGFGAVGGALRSAKKRQGGSIAYA